MGNNPDRHRRFVSTFSSSAYACCDTDGTAHEHGDNRANVHYVTHRDTHRSTSGDGDTHQSAHGNRVAHRNTDSGASVSYANVHASVCRQRKRIGLCRL